MVGLHTYREHPIVIVFFCSQYTSHFITLLLKHFLYGDATGQGLASLWQTQFQLCKSPATPRTKSCSKSSWSSLSILVIDNDHPHNPWSISGRTWDGYAFWPSLHPSRRPWVLSQLLAGWATKTPRWPWYQGFQAQVGWNVKIHPNELGGIQWRHWIFHKRFMWSFWLVFCQQTLHEGREYLPWSWVFILIPIHVKI